MKSMGLLQNNICFFRITFLMHIIKHLKLQRKLSILKNICQILKTSSMCFIIALNQDLIHRFDDYIISSNDEQK